MAPASMRRLVYRVASAAARLRHSASSRQRSQNLLKTFHKLVRNPSSSRRWRAAGAGAAALAKLVAEIDAEISEVQAIIVRDQRWEKRVTTRYDVIELKDNFKSDVVHDGVEDHVNGAVVVGADDGTGSTQTIAHEVVSNVLVGAEEAEARLAELLQRKRELLGE